MSSEKNKQLIRENSDILSIGNIKEILSDENCEDYMQMLSSPEEYKHYAHIFKDIIGKNVSSKQILSALNKYTFMEFYQNKMYSEIINFTNCYYVKKVDKFNKASEMKINTDCCSIFFDNAFGRKLLQILINEENISLVKKQLKFYYSGVEYLEEYGNYLADIIISCDKKEFVQEDVMKLTNFTNTVLIGIESPMEKILSKSRLFKDVNIAHYTIHTLHKGKRRPEGSIFTTEQVKRAKQLIIK